LEGKNPLQVTKSTCFTAKAYTFIVARKHKNEPSVLIWPCMRNLKLRPFNLS
jgi:hypothetical protein